jgi:hypothetical protein
MFSPLGFLVVGGAALLGQAVPDRFELPGDERVAQIGRVHIEIIRPFIAKPPLDRDESLRSAARNTAAP